MALDLIKRAERAELKALRKVARQERRAERRAAFVARWPRWTAWWEARARELKIAATVVGAVVALVTGIPAIARNAAAICHAVKRAWTFYADRDVGPADQPKGGDVATLATDRFQREHPPDAGTTR